MRQGTFASQPDYACSFSVAAGAITANTLRGRGGMTAVRTAAGVYTTTFTQGGIADAFLQSGFSGSFVGAVGAIGDIVSTDNNVKVWRFFDNAGAAVEPITIRLWANALVLA